MVLPVQITFQNLPVSSALESVIRARAAKLDRYHPRIMACRVSVMATTHRHHKGNLYNVRIDVTVPGAELSIGKDHAEHHEDENVRIAIRCAFEEMRRQLQDCIRRQRGDVKTRLASPRGKVVRLFPKRGFGFIHTDDGRDVYFHENSVLRNHFRALHIGSLVRFAEEDGYSGPQASSVSVAGK